MDIIKHIEWACDTIRHKDRFGLPDLQAAYSRERRAKGALLEARKEIIKLREELKDAKEDAEYAWSRVSS